MQDCKMVITVRGDAIDCQMENISMVEIATLAGYLQLLTGQEAISRGVDIEDIKSNMLDVHLEAMETLEGQIRNGLIKVRDTS